MPLPESNLPPDAQKWRRAIEKDLAELKKAVGIAATNLTSTRARFTGVANQAAAVEDAVVAITQEVGEVADEAHRNDRSSWEPKPPENPRHNQKWFDTTDGNLLRVWIDHGEYPRINYALNPNFSEGTENWTLAGGDLEWRIGFDPHADLVATSDGATFVLEEVQGRTVSLELEETEDDEDGEGGSEQSFVGVPWSASAHLTAYSDNLDVTAVLEVVDTNDNVLASSGPVVLPVGQVTVVQAPSVLDEYEIVGAKVRLTVTGVDEGDYVSLDKIMLEAIAEPEEDYFDGDMPGVTWETLSQGTVSVWSGEPDWYVLQDDNLKQELYDELEGLDADLTDLHETVLPNLRDRLDDAEDALAPLPGQVAAAVQTAADAEAAALAAAGIAEGKGQVITQISPPTGSRARAENLWVRLPDHKVHIYDEGTQVWVPATDPDLIAAANEAATARQEAQAAQSAAQAAQDAADALGTALATVEGDLATAQGLIDDLEDDVTVAATTAAVENLYVTGTGTVDELVANAVWAAKVAAQKVLAHEVLIGGAQNLWPDPDFEEDVYGAWSRVGIGIERPGFGEGLGVNYVTADGFFIPARYGDTFLLTADMTLLGGEGRGEIWFREADADRNFVGGSARGFSLTETGRLEATPAVEVSEDARYVYLGFGLRDTPPTTTVRWENLRIERMVDHNLIVNGGILARHITASEAMSAKLAEFLEVHADQITAGHIGAARIAVSELFAEMFAAHKITAEEADVGSIVADQAFIAAIEAAQINVGQLVAGSAVIDSQVAKKIISEVVEAETITGATIRTAASGVRFEMTYQGLRGYDAEGNIIFRANNSGQLELGTVFANSLSSRSLDFPPEDPYDGSYSPVHLERIGPRSGPDVHLGAWAPGGLRVQSNGGSVPTIVAENAPIWARRGVNVFDYAADRDAALGNPAPRGVEAYTRFPSPGVLWLSDGNSWIQVYPNPSLPFAMASGVARVNHGGTGREGFSGAIQFPPGRFTVPPVVVAILGHSTPAADQPRITAITATEATVWLDSTVSFDAPIRWQAVQMTPTSAEG